MAKHPPFSRDVKRGTPPLRKAGEVFSTPEMRDFCGEGASVCKRFRGGEKKKIFFFLEWRKQRARAVRCQAFDYFFNFQGREMKEGRENNDEEM